MDEGAERDKGMRDLGGGEGLIDFWKGSIKNIKRK